VAIEPRPEQPAPVPDEPGQLAQIADGSGAVAGYLELSSGGTFHNTSDPAKEGATRFVVCTTDGEVESTDRVCEYQATEPGSTWTVTMQVQTTLIRAFEVNSGEEVGREQVSGVDDECPSLAEEAELRTGVVTARPEDVDHVVAWTRRHLTGADYTR